MPLSDPRYAIGIHEAAHAIVGYCVGLTPTKLRIATGSSREVGSAWFAPAPSTFTALDDAVVSVAGEIAEVKEFGRIENKAEASKPRYGDPSEFGERGGDRPVVSDATYVSALSSEDQARAALIASQIVDAHWSTIRSLARELAAFGIVTDFPQLKYVRRWNTKAA